jgi:hypothetical protein
MPGKFYMGGEEVGLGGGSLGEGKRICLEAAIYSQHTPGILLHVLLEWLGMRKSIKPFWCG